MRTVDSFHDFAQEPGDLGYVFPLYVGNGIGGENHCASR
jgi:hypothetical protein